MNDTTKYVAIPQDMLSDAVERIKELERHNAGLLAALQAFVRAVRLSRMSCDGRSAECEFAEQILMATEAIERPDGGAAQATQPQEAGQARELPPLPDRVINTLPIEVLLAKYHGEVWEAAAAENGGADYDLAGLDTAKELLAAIRALHTAPAVPEGWVSADQLPDVKPGDLDRFLVACRRAHNGKTYVFEAAYLNEHFLCDSNSDEEERPFTGWHQNKEHSDYDNFYGPINTGGDVVTHWMRMPEAPIAAAPSAPAEKGGAA